MRADVMITRIKRRLCTSRNYHLGKQNGMRKNKIKKGVLSSGTGKRSRSVYIYFRPVGTRWTDLVATMQLQSMSPILFYCQAHFSQLGCLCTAGWPFPSCKVFTIFIKIVVFFLFLYICALAGHVNILSDKRNCYRRYDLVKWTWYVQIQITTILKYKVTF